jgi:hypothetical protein
MKKSIRILAVVLVAVMLCMTLASCGKKLSGSYKGEINALVASYEVVYDFSGSKVTVTRQVESILGDSDPIVIEGTYEITEDDDGELKITFEYEKNDDEVVKGGTYNFEEGDDYIKIAGIKYEKVD